MAAMGVRDSCMRVLRVLLAWRSEVGWGVFALEVGKGWTQPRLFPVVPLSFRLFFLFLKTFLLLLLAFF
jgi:hypothetical protein